MLTIDKVIEELARYGFSLVDDELIAPNARDTKAHLRIVRGRIQVRGSDGHLLFSGTSIGNFLEGFWLRKPLKD